LLASEEGSDLLPRVCIRVTRDASGAQITHGGKCDE
jgi:hypothetical protein